MKHQIDITITPAGEVQIQVRGVAGPECLRLTKDLEASLGLVVERKKTGEFYEQKTDATASGQIGAS